MNARSIRLPWLVAALMLPLVARGIALGHEPAQEAARAPEPAQKASIGQVVPEHTFRDFLAAGDGRQKLSEFRGQPVLVVHWTDTDFGRGAANEVEKLAKELEPEGLVTILLDTHNQPALEVEASVMRLYPGSPAKLTQTKALPIEYLDNGPPPDVALVGVDGTLLVAGSYTVDLPKAAKLARSELKKRRSGWGDPKAARAARALAHGRGELGAAKAAIEAARQADPSDAGLAAVEAEIAALFEVRFGSVRHLLEHGQPLRAVGEARALAAAVAGDAGWAARAGALLAELSGEEIAREVELDRELSALLKPLSRKAPDREPERLRRFAEEAGATRVGKRALHLAEVADAAARR